MDTQWLDNIRNTLMGMWDSVLAFLPDLIIALLIILVGWIVGSVLGRVVDQIVKVLKVDDALRKAGVEEYMHRGNVSLNSGYFLGFLVKWFIIIAFILPAFELLRLDAVNEFLTRVLAYIPHIIIAVVILIVAALVGDILKRIVTASVTSAGLRSANLIGSVTKWAIWIFAIMAALTQLGVAREMIQTLFVGVVAALAVAFGLAFGLGGQDMASRVLEKTRDEISHK